MTKLLDFTPPIKCSSREARANPALYDASVEDSYKWKAKLTSGRGGHKTVEIRKTFRAGVTFGQMLIIVSGDGWDLSEHEKRTPDRWGRSTRGLNVRVSCNSPCAMSFDTFSDMQAAVAEAATVLGL